jgi:regulator of replication initiation timing
MPTIKQLTFTDEMLSLYDNRIKELKMDKQELIQRNLILSLELSQEKDYVELIKKENKELKLYKDIKKKNWLNSCATIELKKDLETHTRSRDKWKAIAKEVCDENDALLKENETLKLGNDDLNEKLGDNELLIDELARENEDIKKQLECVKRHNDKLRVNPPHHSNGR